MPSDSMIVLNDENFESVVLSSDLPSLVDFWGPNCAPCKAMEPMIEKLAESLSGKLIVGKMNVNECPQTTLRYAIRSLPTLVLIKNKKVVDQFVGRPSAAALDKFVEKAF